MIRWLVWPRQYGKTYQVSQWWLDDPAGRVILTETASLADMRKHELLPLLRERRQDLDLIECRRLLREHVMHVRGWVAGNGHALLRAERRRLKIAVDGAENVLAALLGADIAVITGAGRNEEPDPGLAARAAEVHARWAHTDPPGIDSTVS
jgi:hypothetical protein